MTQEEIKLKIITNGIPEIKEKLQQIQEYFDNAYTLIEELNDMEISVYFEV